MIHAIDQLYLVSFDFYFDGGSLGFGFATQPEGSEDDAIVKIVLPRPSSLLAQQVAWSGKGPQSVLAAPHSRLGRYALVAEADPSHAAFARLIRDAGIRKPDEHTSAQELKDALAIVKAAVLKGRSPAGWGPAAFPETYGQDAIDTATEDDPFGSGTDF